MIQKQEIRKFYKQLRNDMEREQVASLSSEICRHILESPLFQTAEYIYAYYPLGNEADIRPVAEEAWKRGKQVAFPKVFGDEMCYFEVGDFSQLVEGTFGVMEPLPVNDGGTARPVDWRRLDTLVLTPGVAFDRHGNRMGFGKGYYDRHFAERNRYIMLGVAYELQVSKELPTGEFDVALSYIVTENGIFDMK
ncbi:MAG: 5-formyltetrahydrofolate cyclo-ligase [Clostridiales bacterium]|nr:5-formyltetrahydrofolate cyclo-ligase [Clostridiales bacterium]